MKWSPMVPVEQFTPEGDPTRPGVLTEIENIIPSLRGWRSAYGLAETGMESLTATCVGAALAQLADGSSVLLAGTDSGLFLRSANQWVARSGSDTYAATSDLRWRFAQMGDNILAATASNSIQVSVSGGTFTAIAGAPRAALIESVSGFVMAADTNDSTYGDQSDRWWCSGLFDHSDWVPAAATQCTTGRLVDTAGPIRALRRLGGGVVAYKDTSFYLGEYVQPPTVWDWTLISSDIGCASHDAVVNIGKAHLFPGTNNFYLYDGASITPIGDPVREWFFDSQLYRTFDVRIQSLHDAAKRLVYWFYPVAGGSGTLDRAVVYNYEQNRWGYCTYSIEATVQYVASGITYDGIGSYYTTYDAGIDRTYDSPLWVPDLVVPSVFTTTHLLKTVDGNSTTSSFTTWHVGDDQMFTLLRRARVRWLHAPDSSLLSLCTSKDGAAFTLCKSNVPETDTKYDVMASARWHRIKIDAVGTHEFTALAADFEPQGAW